MSHWTRANADAFVHAIATDFVGQILTRMEADGINRKKFARLLNVTPARVSQTLNDPASFNLRTIVNYAQALGMKVSIVAYDDGDFKNDNGPISAEVFSACWKQRGQPLDLAGLDTETLASNYVIQRFNVREVRQEALSHDELPIPDISLRSFPQRIGGSIQILKQGE